ncbi:MAG: SH3 domain-containing protein [Candidatus Marinimicrobia bacterium]|nr:SH3 domain-containing protein [Candidatus Neomarinimicrobiota bacterium]
MRYLAILMIIVSSAFAGTKEIYVSSNSAAVREGPGTNHPVEIEIKRGHQLMEISRQDNWILVGVAGAGGITGWIMASNTSTDPPAKIIRAIKNEAFDNFNTAFSFLNNSIETSSGYTLFTGAEYLGDGIIEVTVTNVWLSAPYTDREGTLQTIFNLWDAADDSGLSIAVYAVDHKGKRVMSLSR